MSWWRPLNVSFVVEEVSGPSCASKTRCHVVTVGLSVFEHCTLGSGSGLRADYQDHLQRPEVNDD